MKQILGQFVDHKYNSNDDLKRGLQSGLREKINKYTIVLCQDFKVIEKDCFHNNTKVTLGLPCHIDLRLYF